MSDTQTTDAVIIGAGITGLGIAHYLKKRGLDVLVLEKGARAGGVIESIHQDGYLFEYGPNSMLKVTPTLEVLFRELNIFDQIEFAQEAAKNRYIVRNGRLVAVPLGPLSAIRTPLFSTGAKLRILAEPFIRPAPPDADETLGDFVRRRLGQEMLDYAINPFVAGVYAGSPDHLSVKAGFPKIYNLEQRYGGLIKGAFKGAKDRKKALEGTTVKPRMFSFRRGMQTLVDALARERGDDLHMGVNVRTIAKTDGGFTVDVESPTLRGRIESRSVVVTAPAHSYDTIPFDFDFPLRDRLTGIEHPPVTVVFFGYIEQPTEMPLDGFGFLVPEKENRQILGSIWSSSLFPTRAPRGGAAFTTFVGGTRQPEVALLEEDQLIATVERELKDLLGISIPTDIVMVKRWERAIPQYPVGHLDFVGDIEAVERQHPGLFITGNFRGGISATDCIEHSRTFSARIVDVVRTTYAST